MNGTQIEKMRIEDLGLQVRTERVLLKYAYRDVGSILKLGDLSVLNELRGFGSGCMKDLKNRLSEAGIPVQENQRIDTPTTKVVGFLLQRPLRFRRTGSVLHDLRKR